MVTKVKQQINWEQEKIQQFDTSPFQHSRYEKNENLTSDPLPSLGHKTSDR